MVTPQQLQAFEKQKQELIDKHGFMVMYVADIIPFAYTIGHNAKNLPEFAIRLPASQEDVHEILHSVVRAYHANAGILDGRDIEQILDRFPVRLKKLSYEVVDQNLGGARKHAEENGVVPVCYQVMWPDKQGIFPGEPGCDPKFVAMQLWPDDQPDEQDRPRLH